MSKQWSSRDEEFLKNNAHSLTTKQISTALSRTPGAVRGKASSLGISLKPDDRKK